jgi:hypothetical protein
MIKFDIEKVRDGIGVVTRDGMPVRILCLDFKSDRCVVAAVMHKSGEEFLHLYTESGYFYDELNPCSHDLLMTVVEKTTAYVNVYPGGKYSNVYNTKLEADNMAMSSRIACSKIEWCEYA